MLTLKRLHFPNISLRTQFLTIAFSLTITTLILGLSAYLTDQTDMNATFTVGRGAEFGIGINTDEYIKDAEIVPGGEAAFDPYVFNEGGHEAFVFMKVTAPAGFELGELGYGWEEVTGVANLYAYCDDGHLDELGAKPEEETEESRTTALCDVIKLKSDSELELGKQTITVTAYAIQSAELTSDEPATVWGLINQ